LEGAFLRFGGVPSEVLRDNAKPLVEYYDTATRKVRFNAPLSASQSLLLNDETELQTVCESSEPAPSPQQVMTWDAAAGPRAEAK
jgi:hypothetical protein